MTAASGQREEAGTLHSAHESNHVGTSVVTHGCLIGWVEPPTLWKHFDQVLADFAVDIWIEPALVMPFSLHVDCGRWARHEVYASPWECRCARCPSD